MSDRERSSGRLLTGVAWVVLLLGLWLWGREVTDLRPGASAPTTGDMAAVGRPPDAELPPPPSRSGTRCRSASTSPT